MLWLAALLALFSAAVYYICCRAFLSPDKTQGDIYNIPRDEQYEPHRARMTALIDDLAARPFEPVSIRSYDGLGLFGRYYHVSDGAPLDIAVHGYRGTAERDMCGGIQLSWALGHNVLLIDQRAHGKSEGRCISFGIRERRDVCAWVDWARERFGDRTKILLYGVSMGAASVLMAAQQLDGKVCGVVADSPYDSPKEIIQKVCRDEGFPPRLSWPLVALSARLLGFSLTETSAAQGVGESRMPVLILHGEDDRFVPAQMSAKLTVREGVERHTFPAAGHGISAIVHTEAYNETVLRFVRSCTE